MNEGLTPPIPKLLKRHKKPKNKKATMAESEIQERAENLLNEHGIKFIHIPGELQRFIKMRCGGKIARIASLAFKGVPDLVIFSRRGENNYCLLLELKTEVGQLSQSQIAWSKGLNLSVAYGWDEAEKIILQFIDDCC